MRNTSETERLTLDLIAVCGVVSDAAHKSWNSDPLPNEHSDMMELFFREVREAADCAAERGCTEIAATLFAWLALCYKISPGSILGGMAARAAFGFRHRFVLDPTL